MNQPLPTAYFNAEGHLVLAEADKAFFDDLFRESGRGSRYEHGVSAERPSAKERCGPPTTEQGDYVAAVSACISRGITPRSCQFSG